MPDVSTVLLGALAGASAGGLVTWLLSPFVAARQWRAVREVQRPRLKAVFPGWGLRGPELLVFNFGGRKTTVTDVGIYGADGSKSAPLWTVFEGAIELGQDTEEQVDAFHPPRGRFLPKVIESGDFLEIPIATSDLAYTVYGRYGRPRLGLSDFWVKEADGTVTRVPVEPELRDGLLQWMPEPPSDETAEPPTT
ncbi:MAG: hypothetical protein QOH92_213 [Chloroflexota bacterium]|jgi:hypothetical protein|nr:hypothetical protein [Chloroflexota bacterium]